jgi:Subtilisin inhibitor-like
VRRVAVAALLLLALVAGSWAASGATALTITIWPDERKSEVHRYTLKCGPPRGTLPRSAAACAALAAGGAALFTPPPKEQACIQVYGGPQRAIVSGTVAGRRVWVSLRRRDGCEVDRWRRLSFLLPVRVGTS